MAIQVRRGYLKDFDPTKMLPGEWAVSIDSSTENQIVWMCFAPGVCKRIGTYEDFQNMIDEINGEIISEYQDAFNVILNEVKVLAKEVSTNADEVAVMHTEIKNDLYPKIEQYLDDAELYATNSANSAEAAKTYAEEAKQYRDEAQQIAGFDVVDVYSRIDLNKQTIGYQKKNLLKNNLEDTTSNGISCVVNSDKSVTLNGTNNGTSMSSFELGETSEVLPAGTYYFNINDGSLDDLLFDVSVSYSYISNPDITYINDSFSNQKTLASITLKESGLIKNATISVHKNVSLNNVTVYPRIYPQNIVDYGYEPYVEDVDTRLKSAEKRLKDAEQGIKEAKNIGLVNLYNGTKDFSGSDWVNASNYITDETYKGFRVWKKNNAWGGACQSIDAVQGEQYVFSCYAKVGTSESGITATAQFFARDNTNSIVNSDKDGNVQNQVNSEWQRIIIPFTVTRTGNIQPRIENTKANSGGLYVCGIKVEKGTVATDWFWSVDDVDNVGITVWQNANASNAVGETTVTVSPSFTPKNYEIIFYDSSSDKAINTTGILPIGTKCILNGVGLSSSEELIIYERVVEVDTGSVVFYNSKIFNTSNQTVGQSNHWAIPYKVIFYP